MDLAQHVTSQIESGQLDPNQFRSRIRNQLAGEMREWVEKSAESLCVYAENLERAIFNATLDRCEKMNTPTRWKNEMFVDVYIRILHSMHHALQHEHIRRDIKERRLRTHRLPFMTHQEIHPKKWASLLDNKVKREQNMFRSNVHASTDSYTCRRCKSNECTFYQMQTRSADEPMTIFISCISCGNQWKQ